MKEIIGTGHSTEHYYKSYNNVYEEAFGRPMMLHYPYFLEKNESLEQRQANLTNFAMSHVQKWKNKHVLEVGCGNGVQSLYLLENYPVSSVTGIDLNADNLEIAASLGEKYHNIEFQLDNAQELKSIEDNSVDILICIESAFHYPDKSLFLKQIRRVLKPNGEFIIADILNKRKKKFVPMRKWGIRMSLYHWTEKEYLEGFSTAKLKILEYKDISATLIKGYRGYRNWIDRKNFKKASRYRMMRLFVTVECEALLMLLRVRRRYYIFSGIVDTQ